MSNLIVGPSSRSTGAEPQSIQTDALNGVDDGIRIGDLWRTLRRRRKLVFNSRHRLSAVASNFVYQRINNPVFAGSFKLLISDPLSDERRTGSGDSDRRTTGPHTTSNDIHLIEVLRSPLLLQPLAKELNTSAL